MNKLTNILLKPIDSSSLAVFRILFGTFMFLDILKAFYYNHIYKFFIEPNFYFNHFLFPGVGPLPGNGMYYLYALLAVSAFGIATGFFYRVSSLIFFLIYTYTFLLDKTNYNNHYYLISLLTFLFIFLDANRSYSIDNLKNSKNKSQQEIPFWQIFILRAQIFIIYFYGGIAKLNLDWLGGEPMREWLKAKAAYPVVGSFFKTEAAAYFFSYGGLFFDLGIGFFLLKKSTRIPAFIAILFFNLVNNWLFEIGVFPFLMLAATVIFVEPDSPRKFINRLKTLFLSDKSVRQSEKSPEPENLNIPVAGTELKGIFIKSPKVVTFVLIFLLIQAIFPLRHWLYPGNVSWTEEGHNFSWHMKLRSKKSVIRVYLFDPETKKKEIINIMDDLTPKQASIFKSEPEMIRQYVHFLKEKLEKKGIENPIIKVTALTSLNSRNHQFLIDPKVNMSEVESSPFSSAKWIVPLEDEPPNRAMYEFMMTFSALILGGFVLLKMTKVKV
jgi:vitamin K-dependent gamma-carboxylase